jgi:cysteine desulfurase
MMRVYLDHNATSPLRPEVRAHWLEQSDAGLGNPSSLHESGRRARHVIDVARERVAAALGAHETEIVFTSGGTESDHLALLGAAAAMGRARGVVTSRIEHSAVLGALEIASELGHRVATVAVDSTGRVDPDVVADAAAGCAAGVVSLHAANNEIGVLQPLQQVAERLRAQDSRPYFHTDAVQALGRIPNDLSAWGVDLASYSAHKLGGPSGVGVLWVRRGVRLVAPLRGGGQEHGLRPGTEPAALWSAAALAIELAVREQAQAARRWSRYALELWSALVDAVPGVQLNGPALDSAARLPNTLNISLPGLDGKLLVMRLDLAGLSVSAGSACASGSIAPSHVLLALGLDEDAARGGLRLSMGWNTSEQDCKRAVEILRTTTHTSRANR